MGTKRDWRAPRGVRKDNERVAAGGRRGGGRMSNKLTCEEQSSATITFQSWMAGGGDVGEGYLEGMVTDLVK